MKETSIFARWYHKNLGRFIPEYAVCSLAACWIWNTLIYSGTEILLKNAHRYDFTSRYDRMIPFVKEWIFIYLICFVFWAVNYILISREGKEHWYRFVAADMLSRLVCFFFFVFLPTTNVRPQVIGTDFASILVRLVYAIDAPMNLFPSIHCLCSWFSYIGIKGSKKVPCWYQRFSFVFALLVCASTQFTKQHYLIDIAGGVVLAQVMYMLMKHSHCYRYLERKFDWIGRKVFGTYYDE
ncbi:MAG: phosphatase PAP2 family protein [Lachnospiraceae bacterium]|nr:phosphatase PAP2 family protein [Lachnospiraceae bacterium]